MSYTIAFDFPEADDPVFAGLVKDALGFAPTLATALRFTDERAAEQTLANGYGPITREFGVVVEVGRVSA